MAPAPQADTIRARLLRLAAVLLLPAVAVAAMVTWRSLVGEQANAVDSLRSQVRWLSDALDGQLGETETRLRLLAEAANLRPEQSALFFNLARATAAHGTSLALWDPEGRLIFDSAGAAAHDENPPVTDEPVLNWQAMGDAPGGLRLSVPMQLQPGKPSHLAAYLPPGTLQAMLMQTRIPPGTGALVLDPANHIAARMDGGEHMAGPTAPAGILAALRLPGAQTGFTTSTDGQDLVFAAVHSQHYHLSVAVMVPLDSITQPSRLSLLLLAGEGGLLIILTLLGAARVSRSISAPIEALAVATRSLGEPGPVPRVPAGLKEVDQVAVALQAAHATLLERRAALAELNATLAARVSARTAELAEANRALADQREQLGLILDHMPIGVLVSAPDGHVIYANPQTRRLLGAAEAPLVIQHAPVLMRNGEVIDLDDNASARARRGITTERELYTLERVDGERFDIEVSAGPVCDGAGRVVLAVTTIADVSDRLAAEEARRRSQRLEAVGQLTGGVAHEFNNLLMAIGGCLDLLIPHLRGERAHQLAESASRATDRGARLTKQLLAFARRQHLQAEPIDLNALVGGLTELLASTLGRSIEIVTQLAADAWPAMADGPQLELVLLNLSINARDAMPGGGRLVISTSNVILGAPRRAEEPPAGEYVRLSVRDSGTGMPPEVLARVFEPFFTTKEVGRGSGLGLPQVLGVAQELGGGVTIDSAVGHGTVVSVFLPRSALAPVSQPRQSTRPVVERALDGVELMVVDDTDEVREVARDMLEELGAVVYEAASGEAALNHLRNGGGADLVLADFTMPHMTGVELSREVAKLRPGLPVVLMTGYSTSGVGDAGPYISAVLQKPFHADSMLSALQQALGRAEAALAEE